MKTIKLDSLHLHNFKGISSYALIAGCGDVSIYGDNATGKSTLFDAFLWLLFDKDSHGKSDFEIKTLEAGQVKHGLEHTVGVDLYIDGDILQLKKIFKEKWTKKKGQAKKEFTGHTSEYEVNGVPVKKKDYTVKIAELIDEGVFRLLTDPKHFNNLHWEKRREILLSVCGDIKDEDVIKSNNELSELPKILGKNSIEDHRKIITGRRRDINKELEKLPVRIDEVEQSRPEKPDQKKADIEKRIKELKDQKAAKEKERSQLEAGGQPNELFKKKYEAERALENARSKFISDRDSRSREQEKILHELSMELGELSQQHAQVNKEQQGYIKDGSLLKETLKDLRQQYKDTQAMKFDQKDTCPTCGQKIPEDQAKKAEEKFNQSKAKMLQDIDEQGRAVSEKKKILEKNIETLDKKILDIKQQIDALEAKKPDIQAAIDVIGAEEFEDTEEAQSLKAAYDEIQAEIEKTDSGDNSELIKKLDAEIDFLSEQIDTNQDFLHRISENERIDSRVKELKQKERDLAAEYEKLEHEAYLTEQFIRSKVNMLEGQINSKFGHARFKLFNEQVNGGIEEACITLCDGVPYPSANNAAQINIGLDIINTLSEYYQFSAPVFIDNAEAVTRLLDTKAQKIELVVSGQYPEMTIFEAGQERAA